MAVTSLPPTPAQIIPLLDVVQQCYRMANVLLAPGRGLSGSEQTEALHIMNASIDGMSIERYFFYQILRTVFAVVANQKDYSVGDAGLGADWSGIQRPEKVLRTGIIVPGTPAGQESEIPIYTVLSYEEYAAIVTKDTTSTFPLVLYYQAGLQLGTATLWPVPRASYARQVVLYTPETVQEFTDISADYIVPRGFREFMEYEGAVKVHHRYPKNKSEAEMQPIYAMAKEYKARVKAALCVPSFIASDAGALGRSGALPGWIWNGRTTIGG